MRCQLIVTLRLLPLLPSLSCHPPHPPHPPHMQDHCFDCMQRYCVEDCVRRAQV